jgi:hypothetical protein
MTLAKILMAGAAVLAVTASARAETAVGLVGDKTLVVFDTATAKVSKKMDVTGVTKLLGIDVRSADKKLYGVSADGSLVSIDTTTGAATVVSKLDIMLPEGVMASVDFNPMADKLRVMGSDGTNLRVDPASGKVTKDGSLNWEPADANAAAKSNVVATAYLNSFGKPEKTAMYDIDAALGLLQQTKPNDGTLKTIGALGIDKAANIAFDIYTTADGTNTAYLVAGAKLYTVDIATGKATAKGEITGATGAIRDVTILPAG